MKLGLLVGSLLMLLLAGCGPADTTSLGGPGAPGDSTQVGVLSDDALTPEEVPALVLDTLPRYPGAEAAPPDSALGFATSPLNSACHGEQCPQVHTASQQGAIGATEEEIEAWYWDQLVSQGYRDAERGYGMRGGNPHSHVVFFHPDQTDVNVQFHFYPLGDGITVLDMLVVYLEPLPKPEGPVIPPEVERVEIDYSLNARTHVVTEPASVKQLAAIANGLPVRPDYLHSCPIGLKERGATLTFVSNEGESWEVRIVNPGCPFRVEFEPYPALHDTRNLLWEAAQEVIGAKEPHEAGTWPGRPTMPTIPQSEPTPTPPATVHSRVPPSSASQVVHANNRFAFDLLAELRQQEGDQNLFISPLSISLALGMTYNGAAGDTRQAMAQVLHLNGMERDAVNQGSAALLAALAEREPDLELGIANSIWAREGRPFHSAFFDRVSQHYDAEVDSLPFDDAAKERINGWVKEQTQGKIDSILEEIKPDDVMYLINAIYFKASWLYAFQEEDTQEGTFHNADGSEVELPMMRQDWAKYDYLDGDGFAALRLPYHGDASMYLFLPDRDSSLPEFLDRLDGDAWAEWMEGFRQGGGDIVIPRFEMEYDATLNDPLKAMGMEVAFGGGADFSDMGPGDLWIDRVVHKAVAEVHEQGTEAAAATIVGMAESGPAFTFEFIVDRPFYFAITDDQTGSVLFMGTAYELGG